MNTFRLWLKLFIGATKPTAEHPVLIILDNHSSRFNIDMLREAMDNHVLLLALPSNTTDILQPLDVGVFGPFKNAAHHAVDAASLSGGQPLLKVNIAKVIEPVWDKHVGTKTVQSAFAKSGIWPLNPRAIPDSKLSKQGGTVIDPSHAMDVDAATHLPPAGPIHSFVHAVLGPDASPFTSSAGAGAGSGSGSVEAKQKSVADMSAPQRQAFLNAAGGSVKQRLENAVHDMSYCGGVSMQALLTGKMVELALLPDHLHGVLPLPAPKTSKAKPKNGAETVGFLTGPGHIARLHAKEDAKTAEKERKAENKRKRAEKKKEKQEEKERKKKEKEEKKAKDKEQKETNKGRKAKPKGKAKTNSKRKRAVSSSESEASEGDGDGGEGDIESGPGSDSETEGSQSSEDEGYAPIRKSRNLQAGFAIVALRPEPSDLRPFGVGKVLKAHANARSNARVEIDLWLPEDRKDLLSSRYNEVLEGKQPKRLQILAGQISCHSFNLSGGCLPDNVREDCAEFFAADLETYADALKHSKQAKR